MKKVIHLIIGLSGICMLPIPTECSIVLNKSPKLIHAVVSDTLLPQTIPLPIIGSTSINVDTTIESRLDGLVSKGVVDLGALKTTFSEPRYIAIGGALTAGVRNLGLYRQAQLTSYPNFIAKQMGLKNFRQPLFDISQGNGSGYKKISYDGNEIHYQEVNNDLAIIGQNPMTLSLYKNEIDNLGIPGIGVFGSVANDQWKIDHDVLLSLPYEPSYRAYLRRLLPNDNSQWTTSYMTYVSKKASDICTIELGLDDAIWYASKGGYRLSGLLSDIANYEVSPIRILLDRLSKSNTKTIVATVPDVLDFPYFKLFRVADLRKNLGVKKIYTASDDRYDYIDKDLSFVGEVNDNDLFLPNENIVSLAKGISKRGLTKDDPLTSLDVLNQKEQHNLLRVNELNALIITEAKRYSIPVFDLKNLYKEILSGNYTSHDGVKIDPSFPNGNFFSSDGINPSALGQAVIANEWINVFNKSYKSSIPLISINRIDSSF